MMNLYLDDFYSNNQLKEITSNIYKRFINQKKIDKVFFDDYFDYPYEVMFGKEKTNTIIYYLLKKYYKNEYYIKRSFYNHFLLNKNATTLFELPLGDSRVDIASINGKTIAYEIKTEYDNLDRIDKQLNDYLSYFEYVYVVCNKEKEKEVLDLIPSCVGLYVYNEKRINSSYKLIKKANKNNHLDFSKMIEIIGKKESIKLFKTYDVQFILNTYSKDFINKAFKEVLKRRYNKKSKDTRINCETFKNV